MQNNRFATINYLVIYFSLIFFIVLNPFLSWSANPLKVGVSLLNPPFSYIGEDDAVPQGFNIDLAKLLSENMYTTMEICPMDEPKLKKALEDGSIDMFIGRMEKSYSTRDISLIETTIKGLETTLYVSRMYSINSYKDLTGFKVAIERGYDHTTLLPSDMNISYIEAETAEDALALVNSGEAQAYISKNLRCTKDIIRKNHFQNIKEIGEPLEVTPLIIAVNRTNSELLSSLSIAYGKTLEDGSYYSIYKKWMGSNLRSYMNQFMKFILAGAGIVILALLSFFLWNRTLKNKVISITRDLRNSEKKYKDLIETSPDMIFLVSMHGKIKLANKIALTRLGYDENEITSLRLHNLVVPEQTDDVSNFINNVFRDNYSNSEFTFLTKDRKKIHVDMVATIVKEAEPAEEFVCCFSRDISERKRLEEDLLYADRLAIMGRMAAGIAHEINNPLGIILSNAQDSLYHKLSAEDSVENLKSIERNTIRAAKIIEDMLNFTRPAPLRLCPVDLHLQVDSTLFLLKQRLKQKDIRIEKSYLSGPVIFKGDENLIQQLLINIILNSIQAIRNDGMIKISVKANGEDGGRRITLEIEDNGIGIPDADLKNIFNPFFTSRKENGFGMGLFISKIIVEKHHGSISAKSIVGQGTVMTVEFPVETTGAAMNEFVH